MQNKRLFIILLASAIVLLIPLIAMQFTDQVIWNIFDFIIAGILLFGISMVSELLIRKAKTKRSRLIILVMLAIAFLFLWGDLAIGLFGMPWSGS